MKGKVAIVTGGGGGLGSEICRRFASRGAAVAVVDMNADAAGQVASGITSAGGRALAVQAEVTDEASVENAVRDIVDALGRVGLPRPLRRHQHQGSHPGNVPWSSGSCLSKPT